MVKLACPINKPIQQMGIETQGDILKKKNLQKQINKLINTLIKLKKKKSITVAITAPQVKIDIKNTYADTYINSPYKYRKSLITSNLLTNYSAAQQKIFFQILKLDNKLRNSEKLQSKSRLVQEIINYDYMSKIPTAAIPCEYVKQDCTVYNDGRGPEDVKCCNKGELNILRCGVTPGNTIRKLKENKFPDKEYKYKGKSALTLKKIKNPSSLIKEQIDLLEREKENDKQLYDNYPFLRDVPKGCYDKQTMDNIKHQYTGKLGAAAASSVAKPNTNPISRYINLVKGDTPLLNQYQCPVYTGAQKQYCNNIYDFSYDFARKDKKQAQAATGLNIIRKSDQKITGKKLSEAVYDNTRGMGNYIRIVTDPDINIGNDYLISGQKCTDKYGQEQYVQIPIHGSSERFEYYKRLTDAINKSRVPGDPALKVDDIKTNMATISASIKRGITIQLTRPKTRFFVTEEIYYLLKKGAGGGLLYGLIDDIKETNPISLLTRFLAQSENSSMKCEEIAKKWSNYPFMQYSIKTDGLDLNENVTLKTQKEYPVSITNCYVQPESFISENSYTMEIILILFIIVIIMNYY